MGEKNPTKQDAERSKTRVTTTSGSNTGADRKQTRYSDEATSNNGMGGGKEEDKHDYAIKPMDTDKRHIPLRASMKSHVIEPYPHSTIISGRSGSGKSCLVGNLLSRNEFYGGYYHEIVLFSPTAGCLDDTFKSLDIPEGNIFNEFDEETLNTFLLGRKAQIVRDGIKKVAQKSRVLFIFDDIIADQTFLRSTTALRLFAMLRHYLCSVMILTQSYNKIPRALRLQANGVYIFLGSRSELDVVTDELCPPSISKKQFEQYVDEATREPHAFIHINNKAPQGKRIRKNMCDCYYA